MTRFRRLLYSATASIYRVGKLAFRGIQVIRRRFQSLFTWLGAELARLLALLQLGRIFRRLGLPLWTFLGIGISTWLFEGIGTLVQQGIAHLIGTADTPLDWKAYVPAGALLILTLASIGGMALWHGSRRRLAAAGMLSAPLQQPTGKQELILLISNPESAIYAINYHFLTHQTLEQVWLIPSDDSARDAFGKSSRDRIPEIQQHCQTLVEQTGRSLRVEVHSNGVSPADAQDTFDAVNRIFRHSPYSTEAIIADFTGGTKPMSAGVIMACLPAGRELQYVSFNGATQTSHGPFLVDYQYSAFDLVG
ncbi:MAG: hypothetical protein AAF215_27985 [Cyanobacteria bacterium P01_A01_bin.123]